MSIVDFSGIGRRSLIGRALRAPLRLIPSQSRVPVIQGPLRGARWIVGSSNHGCWLGSYERDKQLLFAGLVAPGMVVFDVGANVGFYTLLASRRVGSSGRVVAFEPVPRNLDYLRRHVAGNRCDNVQIIPIAASDRRGTTRFAVGAGHSEGFLSEKGELIVETDTIDRLVTDAIVPPPDLIKIDVEGAELRVLEGARTVLAGRHPIILLATHGDQVRAGCLELLRTVGYRIRSIGSTDPEESDEFIATPE